MLLKTNMFMRFPDLLLRVASAAIASAVSFVSHPSFAADVPQSFTLDGQLFSNAAGTTALLDSNIGFKIQILDQDKVCVLYEESQSVSTLASKGYFSVQVGTAAGSTKRTSGDSANTMSTVFQNINAITGKLVSNGAACTSSATGGNRRYVRIVITPSTMGGSPRTLSPDITVDSVPNAVVAERAESVQGFRAGDLLKVNTASGAVLSQNNLESLFTSTARFNALTALVDGTSANYMRSNSPSGAQVPVITGAPSSPTPGSIWYDTSDEKLKYQTTGGPVPLGTGGGSVSSVQVAAPAEFSVAGGPVTTAGTITLTWTNQTANKVFASPDSATGAPAFRALVAGDIPALSWSKITSGTPTTLTGYGITDAVANGGGTPSIMQGLDAGKPATGTAGRIYIAYDTGKIYRDSGAVWDVVASNGSGTVSGTTGKIPKFTSASAIGDSIITESSSMIGIGTAAPGAKLEVAGQVKITGGTPGLGKVLTSDAAGLATWETLSAGSGTVASGTTGKIAKYTGATTVGDSVITEDTGKIGIGQASPVAALDVLGGSVGSGSAPLAFKVVGGSSPDGGSNTYGGGVSLTGGAGNYGGAISLTGGNGNAGGVPVPASSMTLSGGGWGGAGGAAALSAGGGVNGQAGGNVTVQAGAANGGGNGGSIQLVGGTVSGGNGSGGDVSITGGAKTAAGVDGNVLLGATRGNVGVGTAAPDAKLHVAGQVKITGGTPGLGKVLTSDAAGLATWETLSAGSGTVASGTTGKLSKYTGATTVGDSVVTEDTGKIGIGTASPSTLLHIKSTTNSTLTVESNNTMGVGIDLVNTSSGAISYQFYATGSANNPGRFGVYDITNNKTPFGIKGNATNTYIMTRSTGLYGFSSDASSANDGTLDTGISRLAAGSIGFGNGTVGDTSGTITASQIKLTGGSPAAGKVLISDGAGLASWTNFSVGSLLTAAGATQFGSASCTASQTLTWSSLTGAFTCSNISFSSAVAGTSGKIAKFTGANVVGDSAISESSGNIGIGVATPGRLLDLAANAPTLGLIRVQNTAADGFAAFGFSNSSGTSKGGVGYANASAGSLASTLYMNTADNTTPVVLATNTTERVRILGTGEMGIGTATPGKILHVVGDQTAGHVKFERTTSNTTGYMGVAQLQATSSSDMADGFGPGLNFFARDNAGVDNMLGFISMVRAGADNNGDFVFSAYSGGVGGERLYVRNTGLVEIPGTIKIAGGSPGAGKVLTSDAAGLASWQTASGGGTVASGTTGKLAKYTGATTVGDSVITESSGKIGIGVASPNGTFQVGSTNGFVIHSGWGGLGEAPGSSSLVGSDTGNLVFQPSTFAGAAGAKIVFGYYDGTTNRSALEFGNVASGFSDLTILKSGGNVGIGVTGPTSKLQVAGNITPEATASRDLGSSSLRWNNIYLSTAPDVSSDVRLKKDIQDSDLGLDFVNALRPVSWTWKDRAQGTTEHYGVIAQEAERAIAQAKGHDSSNVIVSHNEESDSYSVRYTELIAPVIKAVQELYQRIVGIDRELASLKAENTELKAKAQKAEDENAAIKAYLCAKDPSAAICK